MVMRTMSDERPYSSRREFLSGQAAARELELLASGVADGAAAAPLPPLLDHSGAFLLQVARRAMACDFQVFLNAGQHFQATEHALAALDLVEQLEAQLTVFRDTSEISRLNRWAAQRPMTVETRLYGLLKLARSLYEDTEGAFDVTAGPLSRLWGFLRRQGQLPSADDLEQVRRRVGCDKLLLDDGSQSLTFAQPDMEINLGAIGKGYALDRCAELLDAAGVGDYLVHGGHSSVLARGRRAGEDGWCIGVRDPLRPERRLGRLRLRDQALGTSGAANQFFYFQGRRFGHVLDPRTGWPAEGMLAATVLAATAAEADALATALYVLGPEAAAAYAARRADISVLLLLPGARTGDVQLRLFGLAQDSWLPEA
jgi:FAD:protein FMN transferase